MKILINTIQELIDHGFIVEIYCHNPRCHHRARLDLPKLRQRLGPDQSMLNDDIKHKLVCGRCRSRAFGMTEQPRYMNKGKGWMT